MRLLLLVSLLVATSAIAQNTKPSSKQKIQQKLVRETTPTQDLLALRISKGTAIEIKAYDKDSDTFVVGIVSEPGVGPNVTTLDHLKIATSGKILPKGASLKTADIVGSEFDLSEDLVLLSEAEVSARAK